MRSFADRDARRTMKVKRLGSRELRVLAAYLP
jgi:hypothetical protein